MTDLQIVQLLSEDQHNKAFIKLYGYFAPVRKLVESRGGSKEDALDIYQDALVILYRKVKEGNFVLTSSLNTYLYSICRFLWNDELKLRNRKPVEELQEGNDVRDDETEAVLNESKSKLAEKALAAIGEKCIQLLNLFYMDGKSMEDIAEKMAFSSAKIAKNQKYKCLERAKNKLKELQTLSANL